MAPPTRLIVVAGSWWWEIRRIQNRFPHDPHLDALVWPIFKCGLFPQSTWKTGQDFVHRCAQLCLGRVCTSSADTRELTRIRNPVEKS